MLTIIVKANVTCLYAYNPGLFGSRFGPKFGYANFHAF
jgi:hypothetical protein